MQLVQGILWIFSIPIYWPTFPANFVYSVVERLCDLMHLKMRLESILQAEGQGACWNLSLTMKALAFLYTSKFFAKQVSGLWI